jgi:type VI secretion system secreted protein Hcp
MGVPLGASGLAGDMFLMIKGAKAGLIQGESQDDVHGGEIDVVSWSWGLEAAPIHMGGGQRKANARDLKIIKRVDSASTALLSALRTNELITKAVLTVRKAGKTPLEYLTITIENGRVTEVSLNSELEGPQLVEQVRFSFNKITVEYKGQGKDGQALGARTYNDQFGES